MGRQRKIVLLVGEPGSGKSTGAEQMALHRHVKYNEPVIIYDPNSQAKWMKYPAIDLDLLKKMKSGIYRVNSSDHKLFFQTVSDHVRGFEVIADDSSDYLTMHLDKAIYSNVIGLRHKDNDLYAIMHAVQRIPDYIREQANDLVLYKTGDILERCIERIPESKRDEFKIVFNQVNSDPDPHAWRRMILRKTGTL